MALEEVKTQVWSPSKYLTVSQSRTVLLMISEKYNIFNRETMQCTYNLTKAEIKSTYQCIIPIETKQNS